MVLPFDLLKDPSKRPAVPRSSSSNSALQEALRLNPFSTRTYNTDTDLGRKTRIEQAKRSDLNNDLTALSELFPDIQFDVLREVLVKFDGDSRLQISVGQLLAHRTQWVKGRWHAPPRNIDYELPLESSFRSTEYKAATIQFLSQEFRYLSKSTIEGVLAENNHSYTQARPTLSGLSNRTWRATIGSLNIFKKRKENEAIPTHLLVKHGKADGGLHTGSAELDQELYGLFLEPAKRACKQDQEDKDRSLAEELNETEARQVEALYECECCCGEATFETLSSCTTGAHMVCFDCIRRTVNEAVFGQGWGRSIDKDRGALKCLAPLVDEPCTGYISPPIVRQAILAKRAGKETCAKFDDRLAEDALLKSQLKLIRCPFCSYAEADPTQPLEGIRPATWHLKPTRSITTLLVMIIFVDFLPITIFLVLLLSALRLIDPISMFQTSLHHLTLYNRSPRFICRNPGCLKASCLKCQKAWHDPHTCHEPLLVSLRTTVEAARTAAIKRTCPRCGLSFVKSSGCNKLTCVCGYSMCYLCRTALGPPSFIQYPRLRQQAENTEGYRHFCEHFRLNPGKPCMECRKCDLYKSEDEDAIVKRAGEVAEQEWRVKEGMIGVEGLGEMPGSDNKGWARTALSGEWTLQGVLDWVVGQLVEVRL
jgi:hypothetical protein